MGHQPSRRGVLLGGGSLLLAAGCDLIEFAQNPMLRFALPARTYRLSTNDPAWKKPPEFFAQPISCTSAASCCPPPGAPPGVGVAECMEVPIVCQTNVCGVEFPLEVFQKIDLSKEAPAVASSGGSVFSEITLESLTFKITNGVGQDFPPVKLYIAAEDVTTGAMMEKLQFIGETPPAPAGVVTTQTRDTPPDARKAFAAFARDFRKPFNFIAMTKVAVLSGKLPTDGNVDIEVTGTVTARL